MGEPPSEDLIQGVHGPKAPVAESMVSQLLPPPPAARLPTPPTALVGREREMKAIVAMVRDEARLLTLTGAGGSGKTRLALEVAHALVDEYEGEVCFVELAPLSDPELIASSIVKALELKEVAGEPLAETLTVYLRQRRLLLVLDNFEHLLPAAPFASGLLVACPQLKLVVTSRSPLHLSGEHEFEVPPLESPEAVELFRRRAGALRAGLDLADTNGTVAAICERLDGLPLALELAAARVKLLSPEQLLQRLEQRLPLLTGGARDLPERQRTLRGTIEWSYTLLDAGPAALLRRLSVFAGGCTLGATEVVCAPGLEADLLISLEALLDNSLLRQDEGPGGDRRFAMLETIREYALDQLGASDESDDLRRRHAEWVVALAEEAEPELFGPRDLDWFERLETELDNVRAALDWSIAREEAELALRLAGALSRFWKWCHLTEGESWLERAIKFDAPASVRAKALYAAGVVASEVGRAVSLLEQSIALMRDEGGPAILLERAVGALAFYRLRVGDRQAAAELAQEAVDLSRQLNDKPGLAHALDTLADALGELGEAALAWQAYEECLAVNRELGDACSEVFVLADMAEQLIGEGDPARAREFAEEALSRATGVNDVNSAAFALCKLAQAAVFANEFEDANRFLFEYVTLSERAERVVEPDVLATIAALSAARGEAATAVRLSAAAMAEHKRAGTAPWRVEILMTERFLDPMHNEMGDAAWRRAREDGSGLSCDEAVTEALEWLSGHQEPAVVIPAAAGGWAGSAMPTLAAGSELAGYRIEELVGRGGMGVVYRATQRSLERPVALKLLAPELAADERFRERFLREARLAASLEHPHVLPVHEAGEAEGLLFLALRYIEGEDLGRVLERGPLAPERACRIVSQLASALQAAHERGLLHRDVKPANVLLTGKEGEEHAYLSDFGLAKDLAERGLTRTGEFLGSVDYLAPEQIEHGNADERSDLYALGCLLYACLTGQPPFAKEHEAATLWAHVHEEPPRPSDARPELPSALDGVVATALAKDPRDRYSSALEFADSLTKAVAGTAPTMPRRRRRSRAPTNLPTPPTSFLGRARELAEVTELFGREDVRLLTLTGAGGTGKTRLALEATRALRDRFEDGVFWVPLQSLRDPDLVLPSMAQAIGTKRELPVHIGSKRMFLLLDNFEQVTAAAPGIADLLREAPRLKVLVTSRVPLHLAGEREYLVPPLPPLDAIALFTERVRAIKTDFAPDDATAAICRRLDGLPLALELAAARVKLLPPAKLLERLEHRLPLLTGGPLDAPDRQRTLRATIEWSYTLLDDGPAALLRRLAVFAGGCTLEAAEAVCGPGLEADVLETLQSLVDNSLLHQKASSDEPRFLMLETIREYAAERLKESDEAVEVRREQAEFFLALARKANDEGGGPEQALWWDRLEAEHDNLRAVLDWLEASGQSRLELELAACLGEFWMVRGYLAEGLSRLEGALERGAAEPTLLRARALGAAAGLAWARGEIERASMLGEHALELFEALCDRAGIARAAVDLGAVAASIGDWERARRMLERARAVAQEIGDKMRIAIATANLGALEMEHGAYAQSIELSEESAHLARELGNKVGLSLTLSNIAFAAFRLGDAKRAVDTLLESLRLVVETRNEFGIQYLDLAAAIEAAHHHYEDAVRLLGAAEANLERTGIASIGAKGAESHLHEETLDLLRNRLEPSRLGALWKEGRTLEFDEAVAYAVRSLEQIHGATPGLSAC